MTFKAPYVSALGIGLGLLTVVVLSAVCSKSDGRPADQQERKLEDADQGTESKLFSDVAKAAGITNTHHKPYLDPKLDNIMSWLCSVGASAAAADYNNDGWIDIYTTDSKKGHPNLLYRNNGDGTFTDVAKEAGVADMNGDQGTCMDCLWGDYNNDGWPDLYLVRWGTDVLLRNNRDGTFTDVTLELFRKRDGSSGTEWANGNAAVFWDFNLDGRLDIYVGNYFREMDLWNLNTTRIMHDDFEKARNGGECFLYKQQPNGTFVEVAKELGLEDRGWTLAVGSSDVNNDGWPDLYCADDFGPDQLFINNKDGTFQNVAEQAIGIDTKKGMNVDFGDFNNDGWLDIYVANITTDEYLQEGNMLWYNNGPDEKGDVSFTDISLETGTYDGGWGWAAKFFDYDNDGDQDIYAVNGFISAGEGNYWYDLATWTVTGESAADAAAWPAIGDRSFSGYEAARLWRNDGHDTFTQRAAEVGIDSKRDGRGIAVLDYDNDGDLDLFVANQNDKPHLYRNNSDSANHYLIIDLEADPSTGITRDAVGTRVTVVSANGTQIREREGGNGYSSQSDPRLHFGLGDQDRVQMIEVRWADGGLQYLEDVKANQILTVKQNPAAYASQLAINRDKPEPRKRRLTSPPKPVLLDPQELERKLTKLEDMIRQKPKVYAVASRYRRMAAENDRHERAVRFFEKLVRQDPDDLRMRVELASVYIDKIPTCGGVAAVVSKGTLARKSLDQLDIVIEREPHSWVATYCRGMNHLHWPRALRHSDDAARDFQRCIELQKKDTAASTKPYYLRTYVGLGDAHAKAKQYEEAKQAWRDGLALFPDSKELKARLAIIENGDILDFVLDERNLEQPIDTGLGFLD